MSHLLIHVFTLHITTCERLLLLREEGAREREASGKGKELGLICAIGGGLGHKREFGGDA